MSTLILTTMKPQTKVVAWTDSEGQARGGWLLARRDTLMG